MKTLEKKDKLFSLDQANLTLPLVSRIVRDIVRAHEEADDLRRRANQQVSSGRTESAESLQDSIQQRVYEIREYKAELESVGCILKDPASGLVDFPSRLEGRVVYLCWKLGEPEISSWHEVDAGFTGRQDVRGYTFSGERDEAAT